MNNQPIDPFKLIALILMIILGIVVFVLPNSSRTPKDQVEKPVRTQRHSTVRHKPAPPASGGFSR